MTLSAERNAQIDAVFNDALDRSPETRAGFLEQACAADTALLEAVQRLLDLVSEDDAFTAADVVTTLWQGAVESFLEVAEERRPESFGPYQVVREIGRGGMGAVYLAERVDGEFEQRVALKVVPTPFSSEEGLRRFERERSLLAKLSHSNIARLLDGGRTPDGRPYLVMEYVDGLSLDLYCEQRQAGLDERIRLFLAVTEAVQFAHRNLIVHRDLKPSNIVVDREGGVKLLDFGIALPLTEGTADGITSDRWSPMTPAYASPEQFRGLDVTTASDVYQLGLILYELLTGGPAQLVSTGSPADWERAICVEDPPRPSQAAAEHAAPSRWWRRLRGDLDTIVLRALHKDPDRRYGSVAALAADLERFRQGFPVAARPDTLWYRIDRFTRRHRFGVATVVFVGLLLSGYAITATIQQRRIEAEAAKARVAIEFLTSNFRDFTRRADFTNRGTAAGPVPAREVIDRTATRAIRELANQPQLQAEVLTRVGELYLQLGHYDRSVETLEPALAIRSQGPDPLNRWLSETSCLLGMALHYSGRLHEAEPPMRRSYETAVQVHGAGSSEVCWSLRHLGDLLHSRGDLNAAEELLIPALVPCRSPALRRVLAGVLRDRGKLSDAISHYRTAIESEGASGQTVGIAWMELGLALTSSGDLEAAGRALDSAAAAFDREYGGEHLVDVIRLRYSARLALARGELEESERLTETSLAMWRDRLGEEHHLIPRWTVDQAALAIAFGRPVRALEVARGALRRYDELRIPNHPMAIEASQIVGAALLATGDIEPAIQQLRTLAARQEELFAPVDPRLGVTYALLAEALERAGHTESASSFRQRSATLLQRMPAALVLPCRIYGPLLHAVAPSNAPAVCKS